MKKLLLLILFLLNFFCVNEILASSGIFQTFVFYTVNSGALSTNHGGIDNTSGTPAWSGQNLGADLSSLVLNGGELQTFKNGGSDVTGATLYYRVYKQGTAAPLYTLLNIPFLENCSSGNFPSGGSCGDGDQKWNTGTAGIDLLSGVVDNGTYNIDIYWEAASSDGTHSDGASGTPFTATFSMTMLPVELISFNAISTKNQNTLLWQTATEINNSHFDIQRSSDSKTWNSIGQIDGKGNSLQLQDYSYVDEKPLDATNYYRLKQVDFDNKFSYSKIVMVERHTLEISVFPNPANDYFYLKKPNTSDKKYDVQLINTKGQTIFQITTKETFLKVEINDLLPGLYVLRLTDELGNLLFAERLTKL